MAEWINLSWLPSAPDDFREQCRVLGNGRAAELRHAAVLAGHRLGLSQLERLASFARPLLGLAKEAGLVPFTLGVIGNANTDFVAPAIVATGLRHGLAVNVVTADYGQMVEPALDPGSELNRARPGAVLLALDAHALPGAGAFLPADQAAGALDALTVQVETIRDGLRGNCGAQLMAQTIPCPPGALFGSLDLRMAGTQRCLAAQFNEWLASQAEGITLFDVAALAARIGLDTWHDPVFWHHAKLPFRQQYVPLYAEHLCRLLAALNGKSRKCLVLDLDNTLWGGVIGDDGLEGIALGQGSAVGEAFLDVQRTALDLKRRGIVLAVCSKNDEQTARAPFREHPEMLLREDDIAAFVANWSDKAGNLERIARQLNLGVDSLVLLDDNPAERLLVRNALPQVAVPELPEDPGYFPRVLLAAGYFESVSFTREDSARAELYRQNAKRAELLEQSRDLRGYLASLRMRIRFSGFDLLNRQRVTQLINKTNQFNLTTRRYSEAEVEGIEHDPRAFTLHARLEDVFGDNGIISVVICWNEGRDWRIDTWVMSCRVFGREVESAILCELVRQARLAGVSRLIGEYVPTPKNALVSDLFGRMGFSLAREDGGRTEWALDVDGFRMAGEPPMEMLACYGGVATEAGKC